MKQRENILLLFFLAALTSAFLIYYPHTLGWMESTDYFIWERTFLLGKLAEAPGVTACLNNYLLQFFRWAVAGALIEGLLLTATALLFGLTQKAMKRQGIPALGLLLPLFLVLVAPLRLDVYLEGFFFMFFVWLGIRLKTRVPKVVFLLLLAPVGFFLIPWPLLALAILMVVAEANLKKADAFVIGAGVMALALSVGIVFFSNVCIGFIPFEKRFLYSPVEGLNGLIFLAVFVVSLLLLFVPAFNKGGVKGWIPFALGVAITVVVLVLFGKKAEMREEEKTYQYAYLADRNEWEQLLKTIPMSEMLVNKAAVVHALLAESELGGLGNDLFYYPVPNTDEFLYKNGGNAYCYDFNRKFYECLGLFDEAIHQAIISGISCKEGMSFGSLRHIVLYEIQENELKMADKYLSLLDRSTCHSFFVKKMRAAIQKKHAIACNKPIIDKTFVGAYPLFVEARMLLYRWPNNKKLLDYYLCGLLLERQPVKFTLALNEFSYYREHKLPRAYAEALAMAMQSKAAETADSFNPSFELGDQFVQFISNFQRDPDPASLQEYKGTYWYYFYLMPKITRGNNPLTDNKK